MIFVCPLQIANLKSNLSDAESVTASEIEKLRTEAEAERMRLEKRLAELSDEYAEKIQIMENSHTGEMERVVQQKTKEAQVGAW